MKDYMLSIVQPDGDPPPPEVLDPILRDLAVLNQEMRDRGVWVFGAGLHDVSTATLLRPKDGDVLITDGPFAEGKEHLGGFMIIRVEDLDAALDWGRRLSLLLGLPVEVRPCA
ncbi:YciI family protein [Nonomuraea sp. NPDC050536]|uniref:YciI family protein n=1 Tax=Nonomuraea sp. NPDC050536 TaxID=3364366 RepID=UPI0037CACFEA